MLRVAFALAIGILFATPAVAAKRVALVIGNSAYVHAPALPNPKNDAADMAQKLESLGFSVTVGVDLDLAGVKGKIREFRSAAAQAELALFFYAGHGIQAGGVNYMLPVDADIADEAALDLEALEMDTVLKAMADVPTLVVLLDACRDNPFEEKLARSLERGGRTRNVLLGKGLAQLDAGTGTLVAFSTQPGNVALDGDGRNSPFTAALLKHIGQPGMSLTDELILVRNEVLGATGNRQRPWDSSSLTGRVVLKAAEPVAQSVPPAKSPIEADFDLARSLGTKEAWEAFLTQHGGSRDMRVELAKREIAGTTAGADVVPFDTRGRSPDGVVEAYENNFFERMAAQEDKADDGGGPWAVQLASRTSLKDAQATFLSLQRQYPGVLGQKLASIRVVEVQGKGTFFRVRIPADSKDAAIELCNKLKVVGGACFLTR